MTEHTPDPRSGALNKMEQQQAARVARQSALAEVRAAKIAIHACAGMPVAALTPGIVLRMREAITSLLDALSERGWVNDLSYCEICDRHALRDPREGFLVAPVQHKDDCPAGQAIALLSEIDGAGAEGK